MKSREEKQSRKKEGTIARKSEQRRYKMLCFFNDLWVGSRLGKAAGAEVAV